MKIDGWNYYNHAALPTCMPHEKVNLTPIKSGEIWKLQGKPLLARWTSDFDCGKETNWWYVIKDKPFDISQVKAKRRYEINKGNKNFDVRLICPQEYKEEIYKIHVEAFSVYPIKYRPFVNKENLFRDIDSWSGVFLAYGAFDLTSGDNTLCGYSLLKIKSDKCISFSVQKTIPKFEKQGVNSALVYKILQDQGEFLKNGGYIFDGERNINHETKFQDYLEKYFLFRKAFCNLHRVYKPKVAFVIKLLYPFRKLLIKFDNFKTLHKINALLKMEYIYRKKFND